MKPATSELSSCNRGRWPRQRT